MNEIDKCHVMVDLETYSTNSNAVIRSIGVVLFNMKGEREPIMHVGVELESCLMAGLVVDQETINFWRKQPEEYRNELQSMPKISLRQMLDVLQKSAENTLTELFVWGHGSNFDIVILENAYKAIGQMAWWKYSNVRDTRTLFDLANYKYVSKGGHNALDDTNRQIDAVCEAYKLLMEE